MDSQSNHRSGNLCTTAVTLLRMHVPHYHVNETHISLSHSDVCVLTVCVHGIFAPDHTQWHTNTYAVGLFWKRERLISETST